MALMLGVSYSGLGGLFTDEGTVCISYIEPQAVLGVAVCFSCQPGESYWVFLTTCFTIYPSSPC
jgi:hypothetical protein